MLNTSVKIYYNNLSLIKNGRIHITNIINNANEKIAVVAFEKPAFDNIINNIKNLYHTIQSLLLLMIFLFVVWILLPYIKRIKHSFIKFLFYLFIAVSTRLLLFILDFPSFFIKGSLTDASNFSSTFAFGIVRSPLEFTITIITITAILILGLGYLNNWYKSKTTENKNWLIFIILVLIINFVTLLTWRGIGASLRSVIFDSTIRYFKVFELFPDTHVLLMNFNILLLGISALIFSLLLLLILFAFNPLRKDRNDSSKVFVILFIFFQFTGWIFDSVQKQPQGTPVIRIVFISILFLDVYLFLYKNYRGIAKYVYLSVGASIATVSLLTYYNSELERESLKTTAYDLMRANQNIYQFMVYQTLKDIQNDENVINAFEENKNLYSAAFLSWIKSLLFTESIPSMISFYDKEKNNIGTFSSSSLPLYYNGIKQQVNFPDDIEIQVVSNIYNNILIKGIT